MLHSLKDLKEYAIQAVDGTVGHVEDIYFDDQIWVVRYFVVATDGWLAGREVLISTLALSQLQDHDNKTLPVAITRAQIKDSPDIDTQKPVSRQHETSLLMYYDFPYYWDNAELWGGAPYAGITPAGVDTEGDETFTGAGKGDHHLRSVHAIIDYHVQANDGHVGRVSDMLVDEHGWAVRYVIIDTGSWWHGHRVLIAPEWIDDVSWSNRTVSIDVPRQAVKSAPIYDASAPPADGLRDTGLDTASRPSDDEFSRASSRAGTSITR